MKIVTARQKSELILSSDLYDETLYGERPEYVKHFWPFDAFDRYGMLVSSYIHDVVGGFHIPGPSGKPSYKGASDEFHYKSIDQVRYIDKNKTFSCFANKDWMIVVVAVSRGAGCFEFTIGGPSPTSVGVDKKYIFLKIQPYYFAINFHGQWQTQPWGYIATKQRIAPTVNRIDGQSYVIGFVKRGEQIEHWVDGVLISSNNLLELKNNVGRTYGDIAYAAYDAIHNMTPLARVRLGHSGTGLLNQALRSSNPDYDYTFMQDGDTPDYVELPAAFGDDGNQVVNEPTQYCGVAICSWELGQMPNNISTLMLNYKSWWLAGNKRLS